MAGPREGSAEWRTASCAGLSRSFGQSLDATRCTSRNIGLPFLGGVPLQGILFYSGYAMGTGVFFENSCVKTTSLGAPCCDCCFWTLIWGVSENRGNLFGGFLQGVDYFGVYYPLFWETPHMTMTILSPPTPSQNVLGRWLQTGVWQSGSLCRVGLACSQNQGCFRV